MSVRRYFTAAVTVVVMAAGALSAGSFDGSESADAASAVPTAENKEKKKKNRGVSPRRPFKARTGVLINDPLSRKRAQVLNDQTLKIIRSTPGGQKIRLSEWNIDSRRFVDTALAAHRRGVTFQILMSGGVASRQNRRTGSFYQLRRGFQSAGNAKRKAHKRSYIRGCNASCRGRTGINHAKFMIVTKTGRKANARNIVSVSSANITAAAGANQWNDTFTVVGRPKVYNFFNRLFSEMAPDKVRRNPYRQLNPSAPGYIKKIWANPAQGRDPVLKFLAPVKCRGAKVRGGNTRIRIAQTVFSDQRGRAIASKLKSLQRSGCRVTVVYTLMDREIRESLNRGGASRVPTRQLVRDTNGDGFYDKYLHTKITTINGWYGKNRGAHVVRTGSENWTQQSKQSDEVGFDMQNARFERTYSRWVDRAFNMGRSGYTPQDPNARTTGIDPFKFVEIN